MQHNHEDLQNLDKLGTAKSFVLHLQSSTQYEKINIVSFVGVDASGSFGIQANHCRLMTCLEFGLSWFRYENNKKGYLALPGGVLYFMNKQLFISTHRYLRSDNYASMVVALEQQLYAEEEDLQNIKQSLHHMDSEVLKRIWELSRRSHYVT